MSKRTLISNLVWSLGLAMATVTLIGFAGKILPYSPLRDRITDALELPALWILSFFFPEGIHTGKGVPNWGYYASATHLAVYTVFWYACLKVRRYVLARKYRDRGLSPARNSPPNVLS